MRNERCLFYLRKGYMPNQYPVGSAAIISSRRKDIGNQSSKEINGVQAKPMVSNHLSFLVAAARLANM